MSELDKLQLYLEENRYSYQRIDREASDSIKEFYRKMGETRDGVGDRHQIIVYKQGKPWFDVICHWGSYGFENGLLEMMADNDLVKYGDCGVEGWLTAQEIINRLEGLGWVR